jgi:hypothetical protein
MKQNFEAIREALASLGVTTVSVEYSGSGDEGSGNTCSYEPWNELDIPALNAKRVSLQVVELRAEAGVLKKSTSSKTFSLEDALELFLDDALEVAGHSGYYNGDGGRGELVINVPASTFRLDHFDYIVEEAHSSHRMEALFSAAARV